MAKHLFQKGYIPWNKGLPSPMKGIKMSEESRLKMSIAKKGKPSPNKGKKYVYKARPKMLGKTWKLNPDKDYSGVNAHNWKGGISSEKGYHYRKAGRMYDMRKRSNVGFHTWEQWQDLKAKYGYMCLCCKKVEPEVYLCVDHVVPVSKGGSNDISNIQPLCRSCNSRKHAKDYDFRPLITIKTTTI